MACIWLDGVAMQVNTGLGVLTQRNNKGDLPDVGTHILSAVVSE